MLSSPVCAAVSWKGWSIRAVIIWASCPPSSLWGTHVLTFGSEPRVSWNIAYKPLATSNEGGTVRWEHFLALMLCFLLKKIHRGFTEWNRCGIGNTLLFVHKVPERLTKGSCDLVPYDFSLMFSFFGMMHPFWRSAVAEWCTISFLPWFTVSCTICWINDGEPDHKLL